MMSSGQKSSVKERGLFCLIGLMGGVGWTVCFVVVPPIFFIIPSLDGWKMERIPLQDFCNSPLHKSV